MPAAVPADAVDVIDHGWHTDLALAADGLTGRLAVFRRVFPGLRVLVLGFGRRSFMIAPVVGPADVLIGPLPGNGAIEATGLSADPARAYADGTLARLRLDPAQRRRLDDFVWASFALDAGGAPRLIARGPTPGSLFYAARRGYSGLDTCNTWTAASLEAAGLPVSSRLDVFAGQTMARVAPLSPGGICRMREQDGADRQ